MVIVQHYSSVVRSQLITPAFVVAAAVARYVAELTVVACLDLESTVVLDPADLESTVALG